MLQCPRCGSGVPDGRKSCHICSAPLSAENVAHGHAGLHTEDAPIKLRGQDEEETPVIAGIPGIDSAVQPRATQADPLGAGAGDARVALTGEVIDTPIPVARPGETPPGAARPGAPIGTGPTVAPPPPPRTVTGPAKSSTAPAAARPAILYAEEEQGKARSKASGVAVALLLLVLIAGGLGGFFYYQKLQRAPAEAADRFLGAFKSKDWKTAYGLMALPGNVTEEQFTQGMGIVGNLFTIKDYKVGEVKRDGEKATVAVTVTASIALAQGREETRNQSLPMKLVEGKWKLDASSAGAAMGGMEGMGGGARGR